MVTNSPLHIHRNLGKPRRSGEVEANRSRENISKSKIRAIIMVLNSGIYQDLKDLLAKEIDGADSVKIMNEIVALGLKQYRTVLC